MYYAIYQTQAPVMPKTFASQGQATLSFNPQVSYKKTLYQLKTVFTVATPSQVKQFTAYCERMGAECEVNVS